MGEGQRVDGGRWAEERPAELNESAASEQRGGMFIDRVTVRVEAGTGGSGCTSFRREKFVPMGGPDGGDGGRGGDIIVRGDTNLSTLLDYTYRDHWKSERGEHGMGKTLTIHFCATALRLLHEPAHRRTELALARCIMRAFASASRPVSPK